MNLFSPQNSYKTGPYPPLSSAEDPLIHLLYGTSSLSFITDFDSAPGKTILTVNPDNGFDV